MPLDVLAKIQSFANGGSVDAGTKGAINQMIGDAQQNPALQSGLNGIANAVTNNGADINPDTMAKLARAGQAFSKAMEQANLAMLGIHGSFNSIDVAPLEKAEESLTGIAEHGKNISINIGTKDAESSLSSIANRLEKIRSSASIGVSVSTSIPRATSAPKAQKFATGGRITYHRQNTETAQTGGIFRHGSSTGDRNMIFANRGEGIITEKAVRQGARQRGMSPESYVQALNHPSTNLARVKKGRSFQYGGLMTTGGYLNTTPEFNYLISYLTSDKFHGSERYGTPARRLQEIIDDYVITMAPTAAAFAGLDANGIKRILTFAEHQETMYENDIKERLSRIKDNSFNRARVVGTGVASRSIKNVVNDTNTGIASGTIPTSGPMHTTASSRQSLKTSARTTASSIKTKYENMSPEKQTSASGQMQKLVVDASSKISEFLKKATDKQIELIDSILNSNGVSGGINDFRSTLEDLETHFSTLSRRTTQTILGYSKLIDGIDFQGIEERIGWEASRLSAHKKRNIMTRFVSSSGYGDKQLELNGITTAGGNAGVRDELSSLVLRSIASETDPELADLKEKFLEQLESLSDSADFSKQKEIFNALNVRTEADFQDMLTNAERLNTCVKMSEKLAPTFKRMQTMREKQAKQDIEAIRSAGIRDIENGMFTRSAVNGIWQKIDIDRYIKDSFARVGMTDKNRSDMKGIAVGYANVKKSSKANMLAQYGLEKEFGGGASLSNIMEALSEGHGVGGRTYDETMKGVLKVMKEVQLSSDSLEESASDVTDAWDKETDAVKKVIKQLPILGGMTDDQIAKHAAWIAGLSLIAKNIQKVVDTVADFVTKQADLSAGLTRASQMVDTFSGKANNFDGLRKSLNMTREQAVALGESMSQVALKGVHSVDTVAGIAQNLKSALGKVDTTLLKEAVNLINDLPKEQVDVLITGTGSLDDKANLIANLINDGNLEKTINLMMNGAFGEMEGSIQLDEKDMAVIEAQNEANMLLDDIKRGMYSIIPKGFAESATFYSKIAGGMVKGVASLLMLFKIAKDVSYIAYKNVGKLFSSLKNVFKRFMPSNATSIGTSVAGGAAGTSVAGGAAGTSVAGGATGATGTGAVGVAGATTGASFVLPAAIMGAIALAISGAIAYVMKKHADKLRKQYDTEKSVERKKNEAFYGNTRGRDIYDDVRSVKIAGIEGQAKGLMIGATTGAVAGALAGSIIGSAFAPGVGTFIGGLIGGAIGGLVEGLAGSGAGKWLGERSIKQKSDFHHTEERTAKDYFLPNPDELTNKSIISRRVGGAITPLISPLADFIFGDSYKVVNDDKTGERKEYYDKLYDKLDDLSMGETGQVLTNSEGRAVSVNKTDENGNEIKDSSGRPVKQYAKVDEYTGKAIRDEFGKPIMVTIDDMRKSQMKQLIELNKHVKKLEFIVKDKYTAFNKMLENAASANIASMSSMGGTNENFGKAVKILAKQNTVSYTTKMNKVTALKTSAMSSKTDMSFEHRANLYAKIMQDEVKIHQDYINSMLKVVNSISSMPELMEHSIRASIDKMFASFGRESFAGTGGTALQDAVSIVAESVASSEGVLSQHLKNMEMLENASDVIQKSLSDISDKIKKREEELGITEEQAETIMGEYTSELGKRGVEESQVYEAQMSDLSDKLLPIFEKSKNGEQLKAEDNATVYESITPLIGLAEKLKSMTTDDAKKKEYDKQIEVLRKIEQQAENGNFAHIDSSVFNILEQMQASSTEHTKGIMQAVRGELENKYGHNAIGKSLEMQALQLLKSGATSNKVANEQAKKEGNEKFLQILKERSDSFIEALDNVFENGAKRFANALLNISEKRMRFKQMGGQGTQAVNDYYNKIFSSANASMAGANNAKEVLPVLREQLSQDMEHIEKFVGNESTTSEQREYAQVFSQLMQARSEVFENPDNFEAQELVKSSEDSLDALSTNASVKDMLKTTEWKAISAELSTTLKAFENYAVKSADAMNQIVEAWERLPDMMEKILDNVENKIARMGASASVSKMNYMTEYEDSAYVFKNAGSISRSINDAANFDLVTEQKAFDDFKAKAQQELKNNLANATNDEQREVAYNGFQLAMLEGEKKFYDKRQEIQKRRMDQLNEMFDKQLDVVSRHKEGLEIEKDLYETIGAPFEYILDIEQEIVRNAKANAEIEEQRLAEMEANGVKGAELDKQKLKVTKASAEVIKASFGAQRDALDKLLGKMMGGFEQIGGIFGPDSDFMKARKAGQGYTQLPSGMISASGGTVTDYANRVAGLQGASGMQNGVKMGRGEAVVFGNGRGIPGMANGGLFGDWIARQWKQLKEGMNNTVGNISGDTGYAVTPNGNKVRMNRKEAIFNYDTLTALARPLGETPEQYVADALSGNPYSGIRANIGYTNVGYDRIFGRGKNRLRKHDDTTNETPEQAMARRLNEKRASALALGMEYLDNFAIDKELADDEGNINYQYRNGNLIKKGEDRFMAAKDAIGKLIASKTVKGNAESKMNDALQNSAFGGMAENTGSAGATLSSTDKLLLAILEDTHKIVEALGGEADLKKYEELANSINKKEQKQQKSVKNEGEKDDKTDDELKKENKEIYGKRGKQNKLNAEQTARVSANNDKIAGHAYDAIAGSLRTSGGEEKSPVEQALDTDKEILYYVKLIYGVLRQGGGFGGDSAVKSSIMPSKVAETIIPKNDGNVESVPKFHAPSSVSATAIVAGINAAAKSIPKLVNVIYNIPKAVPKATAFFKGLVQKTSTLAKGATPVLSSSKAGSLAKATTAGKASNWGLNLSKWGSGLKEDYLLGKAGELYGSTEKGVSSASRLANKVGSWSLNLSKGKASDFGLRLSKWGSGLKEDYLLGKAGELYGSTEKGVSSASRLANKVGSWSLNLSKWGSGVKGATSPIANGTKSVFARGLSRAPRRALIRTLGRGGATRTLNAVGKGMGYVGKGMRLAGKVAPYADLALAAYGAYKGWNAAATNEGVEEQMLNNSKNFGGEYLYAAGDDFKNGNYMKGIGHTALGLGRGVLASMDFLEHGKNIGTAGRLAYDTITESYGQADRMKELSSQLSSLHASEAEKQGIKKDDYDAEVKRLMESEEGKQLRKYHEAQQKKDTGWLSDFTGNLLSLGGHNRAGKANVEDTVRMWAEGQAKKNLSAQQQPSEQNAKDVETAVAQQSEKVWQLVDHINEEAVKDAAEQDVTSGTVDSYEDRVAGVAETMISELTSGAIEQYNTPVKGMNAPVEPAQTYVQHGRGAYSGKSDTVAEKARDALSRIEAGVNGSSKAGGYSEQGSAPADNSMQGQGQDARGMQSGRINVEVHITMDTKLFNAEVVKVARENIQSILNKPGTATV